MSSSIRLMQWQLHYVYSSVHWVVVVVVCCVTVSVPMSVNVSNLRKMESLNVCLQGSANDAKGLQHRPQLS